jgi:DTW domain-containing protein
MVLVIHRVEARKPTNTGSLAVRCLQNSETWIHGLPDQPVANYSPDPETLPLWLFPGEGATPINKLAVGSKPVTLFVPDGTWRQASKMQRRIPGLNQIQLASLPAGPDSQYRLRRERREGGLATLEAVARAFGFLEGQEVQHALERVFRIMVERILWSRGELQTSHVTDGIPMGVLQHEPVARLPQTTK